MTINRKMRAIAVAGAAIAALTLSACTADGSGGEATPTFTGTTGPITIGFSPMNQQAPALIGLAQGVQGMVEAGGDKFLLADPNNDPATQASQIEAWITNGQIQGWWSLAASAPSLTSVIKLAQSKGIVGVVNGVPEDYSLSGMQRGISFSMIDYAKVGGNVGDDMVSCLASRGKGSTGEVIFVTNPAGQVGNDEQIAAFKETVGSKATIVAEVAGEANAATSQAAVASALQAHPNAIGVFGWNDEATTGAVQAIKAAGLNPNNMCVVGGGGGDNALAGVADGSIYGVAALDFGADLAQTVAQIKTMAADPNALGVQLITPVKNAVTTVNP